MLTAPAVLNVSGPLAHPLARGTAGLLGAGARIVAAQTGVAESTLRRTREHGRFEADGVLAMAEWLGRPVEEFTRPGDLPPEAVR